MESHREDIASKLLHSSDARIAEAAKRVFSSNVTLPPPAGLVPSSSTSAGGSGVGVASFDEGSSIHRHRAHANECDRRGFPSGGLHPDVTFEGVDFSSARNDEDGDSVGSNDGDAEDLDERDKKPSSTDRLKRSRERNRMHARKTRQRKKEHMQKLQNRVDELKHEQIRIKQAISEKNTASILLGLLQNGEDGKEDNGSPAADPRVEELLKRSTEEIPDASNIPELPALILPGNGKRKFVDGDADGDKDLAEENLEDGIDYMLLGKDRSACTPAELDQIRRERNRMHAKRTRDRKRIFMEEMEVMIKKLEDENSLLLSHANMVNAYLPPADDGGMSFSQAITPPGPSSTEDNTSASCKVDDGRHQSKGDFFNQIESLLAAAGSFQRNSVECEINAITCAESDVTASTSQSDHNSLCEEEDDHGCELLASKRQCMALDVPSSVPKSITTTNYSL